MKTIDKIADEFAELNHDPAIFMDKQQIKSSFLSGYAFANRWVAVGERLPENKQMAIWYNDSSRTYEVGSFMVGYEYIFKESYTHWQRLPEPPTN